MLLAFGFEFLKPVALLFCFFLRVLVAKSFCIHISF